MIAISVITAPRRTPTLGRSIESLRAAGCQQLVHVYAEPDTAQDIVEGAVWHRNETQLGTLANWFWALEQTVARDGSEWVLILEDDVSWAAYGWSALLADIKLLHPKRTQVGYLSLYLPVHQSNWMERVRGQRRLEPGIHSCVRGWESWGSQAYVLSRASAIALLHDPTTTEKRQKRTRNQDRIISDGLIRLRKACLYRVPCLVNHDLGSGLNSSLHEDPTPAGLETAYWTGHA